MIGPSNSVPASAFWFTHIFVGYLMIGAQDVLIILLNWTISVTLSSNMDYLDLKLCWAIDPNQSCDFHSAVLLIWWAR